MIDTREGSNGRGRRLRHSEAQAEGDCLGFFLAGFSACARSGAR